MLSDVAVGRLKDQVVNFTKRTRINSNASIFKSHNYSIHPLLLAISQKVPFE